MESPGGFHSLGLMVESRILLIGAYKVDGVNVAQEWKETKQHPGTDGLGNILGCCLVSLRFLRYIHSIHSVVDAFSKDAGQISM